MAIRTAQPVALEDPPLAPIAMQGSASVSQSGPAPENAGFMQQARDAAATGEQAQLKELGGMVKPNVSGQLSAIKSADTQRQQGFESLVGSPEQLKGIKSVADMNDLQWKLQKTIEDSHAAEDADMADRVMLAKYFNHPQGVEGAKKDEQIVGAYDEAIASGAAAPSMATQAAAAKMRLQKAQEVDSGRLWSQRSTGDRVLASIAAFFGGMGGGPNAMLHSIDQAIEQDVQAQIGRREGAKADVSLMGQLWDRINKRYDDKIDAYKMFKADALGIVAAQGVEMSHRIGSAQTQASLQQFVDNFQNARAKLYASVRGHKNDQNVQIALSGMAQEATNAREAARFAAAGQQQPGMDMFAKKDLTASQAGLNQLGTLENMFNRTDWTSVAAQMFPGTDAKAYNDVVTSMAISIYKSVSGDDRISNSDVVRARMILGTAGRPASEYRRAVADIKKVIQDKMRATLDVQGAVGNRVPDAARALAPESGTPLDEGSLE